MKGPGERANNEGDFDKAIASAARVIERSYEMPYISHATMEPQNCIAHVQDDRVDIIVPTQSPGLTTRIANAVTGIDRAKR
jgi:CO/xanthine dehydrogenase Mo-binding subunit